MENRLVSRADRLIPLGLVVALATWVCIQLVGLAIANSAFEGPEDPEYYKNGLKYAQVLAAGRPVPKVCFQVPSSARAGQLLTLGVQGATHVRVGRPATLREDRILAVEHGQVQVRLPQGGWIVRANDHQARFWVSP